MSNPRHKSLTALALVLSLPIFAQSTDPAEQPRDIVVAPQAVELTIGLRTVTSINGNGAENGSGSTALDFSDTYLYVRPRMALATGGLRGGALFAITFPDPYDNPGIPIVAEANAYLENRWMTLRLGRGRLKTRIVPIPTLRDDDFIRFSDAQNPFSSGKSTADHQFGNTLDASFWASPRMYLDLHAENLPNDVFAPSSYTAFSLNSIGASVGYKQIPALAPISVVRQLGLGMNVYHVRAAGQPLLLDTMAGAWLSLLPDPVHNVDLRMQALYSPGVQGADPTTANGTFRSQAVSAVGSLGYAYRPEILPKLRGNLMAGYRGYLSSDAKQYSVAVNAFYALGLNFEAGLQYQFQRSSDSIPRLYGENFQHLIKLALVASFETVFNPRFDERDSILNVESGYVP